MLSHKLSMRLFFCRACNYEVKLSMISSKYRTNHWRHVHVNAQKNSDGSTCFQQRRCECLRLKHMLPYRLERAQLFSGVLRAGTKSLAF